VGSSVQNGRTIVGIIHLSKTKNSGEVSFPTLNGVDTDGEAV
jgi:hypothetical protein